MTGRIKTIVLTNDDARKAFANYIVENRIQGMDSEDWDSYEFMTFDFDEENFFVTIHDEENLD